MKAFRTLAIALLTLLAWSGIASSQEPITSKWTKLKNQPTFNTDTAVLLTDGTVMMHQYNSTAWWRLTPDITGNYVNGTWSALASMPSGYEPLYFASAVMIDGQVLVELRLVDVDEARPPVFRQLISATFNGPLDVQEIVFHHHKVRIPVEGDYRLMLTVYRPNFTHPEFVIERRIPIQQFEEDEP